MIGIDFDGIVAFDERQYLPEKPGIYFILDSDDNIRYIGRAVNIKKRWEFRTHHRHKEVVEMIGARIGWVEVDHNMLNYHEDEYIKMYSPTMNRSPVRSPKYNIVGVVPLELKRKLVKRAKFNHRSLSQEIAFALDEYLRNQRDPSHSSSQ